MLLSDFDYILPPERIAAEPASPRTSCPPFGYAGRGLADRIIADLPSCLDAGDLLIVNNTRVLPARLTGKRGEAKIQVTLHRRLDGDHWRCFCQTCQKTASWRSD